MSQLENGGIQIANEFTLIEVREVRTRNGERLEIRSPRMGMVIELDPLELESLTWQETETFSRMLEQPFGPGGDMSVKVMSAILDKEA